MGDGGETREGVGGEGGGGGMGGMDGYNNNDCKRDLYRSRKGSIAVVGTSTFYYYSATLISSLHFDIN
jgi:hypothetical protein